MSHTNAISGDLYRMSEKFARSSVGAYRDDDFPVFYLHAATALELLLKSYLASQNPALIADTQRSEEGFHSLLHLCGLGKHAKPSKVRTVSATEAYARTRTLFRQGLPPLDQNEMLRTLFMVRNGVVHLGSEGKTDTHLVLAAYSTATDSLLAEMSQNREHYWDTTLSMVDLHQRQGIEKATARAHRRIDRARQHNLQMIQEIGQDAYGAFLASRRPTLLKNHRVAYLPCPACGEKARADGYPYVTAWYGQCPIEIELEVESFKCDVCGLHLDRDDLLAVEIDAYPILSEGEDFDGDEATADLIEQWEPENDLDKSLVVEFEDHAERFIDF